MKYFSPSYLITALLSASALRSVGAFPTGKNTDNGSTGMAKSSTDIIKTSTGTFQPSELSALPSFPNQYNDPASIEIIKQAALSAEPADNSDTVLYRSGRAVEGIIHSPGDISLIVKNNKFDRAALKKIIMDNSLLSVTLWDGIATKGIMEVVKACENSTVTKLNIQRIGVDSPLLVALLKEIQKTNITTLICNSNPLGDFMMHEIGTEIAKTKLLTVELITTNIGTQGALDLITALKGSKVVKLYLAGNNIHLDGLLAEQFITALNETNINALPNFKYKNHINIDTGRINDVLLI